MRLEFIPMWDLDEHWEHVAPMLEKAIAKQTAMSLESVKADCVRDNLIGLRSEGVYHRLGVQLTGDFGFSVGATVWPTPAGVL